MTKKLTSLILIFLLSLQLAFSLGLRERILSLPGIVSVDSMAHNPFFEQSWIIMVRQPLDHRHPELGSFSQRVILSHLSFTEPVVMITEGYSAGRETGPDYLNELCPLLYANQLFIEHRYFGRSVPDPIDWKYLTVENASADHHHIVELFRQLYPAKWISTGISKGGQAALLHRMFYPSDAALTVAYVAPLNFAVEDKRHDRFIRHLVDTFPNRRKVFLFQKELLKRKTAVLPLFEKYSAEKKYRFNAPVSEIYDYCVLEFAFSFWQWCRSVDDIPPPGSPESALLHYFTEVISPGYFDLVSGRSVLPFFVQAMRQLGYYAYNTKPFRGLMQLRDTKGYIARLFVPVEAQFPWDPSVSKRLEKFMKKEAKNDLLIYGANDPWSASAANPGRNPGVIKIVQPGGCHVSRISSLPEELHDLAVSTLNDWLRRN